jgi:hypothetical protein
MPLLIKSIENFLKGLITSIEESSIPDGAASDNLNWLTKGDKIELRRGMILMGSDAGAGKSRVKIVTRSNGTEILIRWRGKKVEYYDTTTEDWIEIGTDLLGTAGDGEDVSVEEYHPPAGDQIWICGPNVGPIKIMMANLADYADQYDASKNFKGRIKIKYNRTVLWARKKDKSGVYGSHIDEQNYTDVSAENIGTGDDNEKTFNATLSFKAGGTKRTCFAIVVTDGVEIFTDNYDGTLTGDKGGTGTINYMTGAISVTFNTAPGAVGITCDYQWEDSTDGGIADFTYSATRVAAEGFIFRQDDGGILQTVMTFEGVEYCLHEKKTYTLELTIDDTNAINLPFREKAGIPYHRAAKDTGDGIYFIDDTDEQDPQFRLLTLATGSEKIIPTTISSALNLSDYRFNEAWVEEFGDYILFGCRHKDKTYNDTIFAYYRPLRTWDKLEYFAENVDIYNGALVSGDSISNNVYELFSGLDDDDSKIRNYWIGNLTDLEVKRLKKIKRLHLEGEIGPDQVIKVYLDYDRSGWVEVGTIEGDGDYVDKGQAINVGSLVTGREEVGGGGGQGAIPAYHYFKEIKLSLDKFERAKIKFEATEIGYASVSEIRFYDIRLLQKKLPSKYRS